MHVIIHGYIGIVLAVNIHIYIYMINMTIIYIYINKRGFYY